MTDALVTWLARALDHAEEVVRAALRECGSDARWYSPSTGCVGTPDPDGSLDGLFTTGRDRAYFIVANDPRAVLARVEAARAMLREHGDEDPCTRPLVDAAGNEYRLPCDVVRWLAYGHRFDIEGWRDEWVPEGVGVGADAR